jgi:hypothetical protein
MNRMVLNTRARLVLSIGLLAGTYCAVYAPFIHTLGTFDHQYENVVYEWVWVTPYLDMNETVALDWLRLGAELLAVAVVTIMVGLLQSLITPSRFQHFLGIKKSNDVVAEPPVTMKHPESTAGSADAATFHTPRALDLRQNLLTKVLGQKSVFERLVMFERGRAPELAEEELLERAIARLERDNR